MTIIDDRIDVLTRGTLGLTVSCARCHDQSSIRFQRGLLLTLWRVRRFEEQQRVE
jgi:hypothetical protein